MCVEKCSPQDLVYVRPLSSWPDLRPLPLLRLLTYSRARGLFAGINLNGAAIKQDRDETAVLYGKVISFKTILSGATPVPSSSGLFLATVRRYSNVAAEKAGE